MQCPECGGELQPCSPKFVAKRGPAWACRSGNHHLPWSGLPVKGLRIVWPEELQAQEAQQ